MRRRIQFNIKSIDFIDPSCSIESMQPGAIIVNVSRGGLVDVDAAMDALETGQLGGLALDVYEQEGKFRA